AAEERRARRWQPGRLASGWTADRGLGAGRSARGDARSDPYPLGGGAGGAHGPSTTECISIASRADLSQWPAALDQGASRMAGRPEFCPARATDRVGGKY